MQPFRYAVLDKGVDLNLQVSREVPDYVTTDPLRLRQMLNNLIGNAAKFTASGEIRVDVNVTRDEPSPRLRFAVRDTGIGMPPDVSPGCSNPLSRPTARPPAISAAAGSGCASPASSPG